jgi:hypothetical protein
MAYPQQPGMFGPMMQQMPPDQRQRAMTMFGGAQRPGSLGMPPQGALGQRPPQAPPGMPQPGQVMPQPGQNMPQQPGMIPGFNPQQFGLPPLGAATPEQAAQEKQDAMRRAGQPGSTSGLFQPTGQAPGAPTAQPGTGNVFAGGQDWFSGLFNQTNKTSPFDSFYVDRRRSDSML